MSFAKIICGCLFAGSLTVLTLQRTSIATVRHQNEALSGQQEEAARLSQENESIPGLKAENAPGQSLRDANLELLKLRNEVRQLRAQAAEPDRLRGENQALTAAIASLVQGKVPRLADMDGYVAKESWSNAGFASPEATLQSFFWAVREGQLQQIAECLSPADKKGFEEGFKNKPPADVTAELAGLTRMGGYRIADRTVVAGDDESVVLAVQAAASGAALKMTLKRFGSEWKITGF